MAAGEVASTCTLNPGLEPGLEESIGRICCQLLADLSVLRCQNQTSEEIMEEKCPSSSVWAHSSPSPSAMLTFPALSSQGAAAPSVLQGTQWGAPCAQYSRPSNKYCTPCSEGYQGEQNLSLGRIRDSEITRSH